MKQHIYHVQTRWTGNLGEGTSAYRSYSRNYNIHVKGKPVLEGTSDPAFLGDPEKYNPEEMFIAAISACHMLWYLHLCTDNSITVISYEGTAEGVMELEKDGSGRFISAVLKPRIVIKEKDKMSTAESLHVDANRLCFIANSCNFKISHEPEIHYVDDD
ncbi:MAG: OsmC family protein [Balneolaceae bacterium]